MNYEHFESQREFNKKYPSRVYKCHRCGKLTVDENICTQCGAQANTLFGDTYKYNIGDSPIKQIFIPIEKVIKESEEKCQKSN